MLVIIVLYIQDLVGYPVHFVGFYFLFKLNKILFVYLVFVGFSLKEMSSKNRLRTSGSKQVSKWLAFLPEFCEH